MLSSILVTDYNGGNKFLRNVDLPSKLQDTVPEDCRSIHMTYEPVFVLLFSSFNCAMHKRGVRRELTNRVARQLNCCMWRVANCTCRPQQSHLPVTTGTLQPRYNVCDVTFISLSNGNPQVPHGAVTHPACLRVASLPTPAALSAQWSSNYIANMMTMGYKKFQSDNSVCLSFRTICNPRRKAPSLIVHVLNTL
jgi:hypothetical protein